MKKLLLFLPVLILAGCVVLPPLNTPSGRPEITICGVSKSEIMEKTVAASTMNGFNVERTSDYQIVVGKPLSNPMAAALYGSQYDSTPEYRLVWTFADVGNNCIHVGIVIQIVTNPGSSFERITDISTGKDGHDAQQQLEQLKEKIENR